MKRALLLANILGIVLALFNFSFITPIAEGISTLFLNLLKFISLPIVVFSIASTITSSKSLKDMHHMGLKILKYTLLTTIIAASIALVLFLLINPTANTSGEVIAPTQNFLQGYKDALSKLVPSNFIQAFAENNVIGIAFISVLFSVATLLLPDENKQFLHKFFNSIFQALLKMTSLILTVLPIGIFAFVYILVSDLKEDFSKMQNLGLYLVCIVGANLIQGAIVLPALLKLKGLSVKKLFKGTYSALTLAFFSKSSSVALPLNMRLMKDNMNVDEKVSNFSLPLCSIINMNACAGFILVTSLFVCSCEGVSFSIFEMLIWILVATVAAIGNAGVPMGCYFLTGALLTGLNIPLKMLGLILPFYALLDMLETAINVWSDSCITVIVDKEIKEARRTAKDQVFT